jgi:hypothetical protein
VLSGTWYGRIPPNPAYTGGGVSGGIAGSTLTVSLSVTPSFPCPYNLTATVTDNKMTGTYVSMDGCALQGPVGPVVINGTINLTKQ